MPDSVASGPIPRSPRIRASRCRTTTSSPSGAAPRWTSSTQTTWLPTSWTRRRRSEHVVVDLSATARIDSTGLGALVSAARSCRDAGSVLHIVGAHGMVARALHFTGLSRALSTHATVEDAFRGR